MLLLLLNIPAMRIQHASTPARPMVTRVARSTAMLDAATALSSPLIDPIATGFEIVTLVPQPFWLLLVLLPNWRGTRAIFEPIWPLALLAAVHLGIVVLSTQGSPEVTALALTLAADSNTTETRILTMPR